MCKKVLSVIIKVATLIIILGLIISIFIFDMILHPVIWAVVILIIATCTCVISSEMLHENDEKEEK